MDTKLTLKLNDRIIKKAKKYASTHNTSLSRMVENYLQRILSENEKEEDEITPLVKSLSGIVKLPNNYDSRKEYADFLSKKYK